MPLAYHIVISAYGLWLPNDPRGSGSRRVGSGELWQFDRAKHVSTGSSVAHTDHDHSVRLRAKESLKRPAVRFSGVQARAIGRGFGRYAQHRGVSVYACAILPDHAHLVVAASGIDPDQLMVQLKGAASRELISEGIHPFGGELEKQGRVPKCWGRGGWKVYLDTEQHVRHAIRYVEENPVKDGLRRQSWGFVTGFE